MSKETGIFVGVGNMDKEVILQESTSQITRNLGGEINKIDFSKSRGGWFNPFTGESSHIEKLKEDAKKAIKARKYKKAYRLLKSVKKLTKGYYEGGVKKYKTLNKQI